MASPTLDHVVGVMMDALDDFLPLPPVGPPPPGVSLVSVTEKSVGVGNLRGVTTNSPFSVSVLKGVRLDALVRFQVWAGFPAEADSLITQLHAQLLAARDQLKAAGFITLVGETTSLADHIGAAGFWRKTTDYRVLYEFAYQDSDDSFGLIARIPVGINSQFNEHTVVTDETVRWNDTEAPELEVRAGGAHPFRVGALSILAFLPPGWDGEGVTISASAGGVLQQRSFASVREFFDSFVPEAETLELGGKEYRAGRLGFPNVDFPAPILLAGGESFFRVTYANPPLNHAEAVVYLRVLR